MQLRYNDCMKIIFEKDSLVNILKKKGNIQH